MIGVGGEWGALGWRPPSCEGQRSIAWWRRTGAMQGVNFAEFIFQRLSEKGKRVPRSWISEGAKRPNKALWVRSRRLTVLAWASLTNLQTVSLGGWVNSPSLYSTPVSTYVSASTSMEYLAVA